MNKTAKEILISLANRCLRDSDSAFQAANAPGVSVEQRMMLLGKNSQATQIYCHIQSKYPSLGLCSIREAYHPSSNDNQ